MNGEERVASAVDAIYRYVEEHPQASRLLVLELQGASVSAVGRELEDRLTDHLAGTLGSDPGLFGGHPDRERQLVILAELLKAAVLGLTSWWYRTPDADARDLVERTVERGVVGDRARTRRRRGLSASGLPGLRVAAVRAADRRRDGGLEHVAAGAAVGGEILRPAGFALARLRRGLRQRLRDAGLDARLAPCRPAPDARAGPEAMGASAHGHELQRSDRVKVSVL